MNDFHDPELERLFGRNSGPTPDVEVAYQRVQGRVRQVKRRRAVVVSGAACSLLFAAAVFAGVRNGDGGSVQPGGSGTGADGSPLTVSDSSDVSVSTTGVADTTLATDNSQGTGSSLDTGTVVGGGTAVTSPGGSAASTAPGATTGSVPTSSNPSSSAPSGSPATTTPSTNAPAPVTQTFSGVGGSVTVRLQNGSLTLVSYNATSGFSAEVNKSGGSRVEVRFESNDQRTDIRVDIVGGNMSPQIDES